MAALAAAGSLMGSAKANKNAYMQQLQIAGDLKSSYVNLQDSMESSKQQVGIALTKNEIKSAREMATHLAARADKKTAGASAVYSYANFIQQKAYTTGTIVEKGEEQLRDYGKQAQAKYNQAVSGINAEEGKKKGAFEMILDATMAGAQGYSLGKSL